MSSLGGAMRIDVIDTGAGYDALRENWDAVYAADPHARHFLSWIWLRAYLKRRGRWLILALREKPEGSPYVAFFPLRVVTLQDKKTGRFYDDLVMAGNSAADYTGFITLPRYEDHAIAGFCAFIKEQRWTHFKMDHLCGPPARREAMIRALQGPLVKFRDSTPPIVNNINNSVCPVLTLPSSFEEYLSTSMRSQSREMQKLMRKVESDARYRITQATPETIDRNLTALFDMWRVKWAPSKGAERAEKLIAATREMLMDCFVDGTLEVPVLWYEERPLGAFAHIIDRPKSRILFYITGRDESWLRPSPGLVLHGYCIRRAIEQGFKTYDFLRGDEPYKYVLGGQDEPITCTMFRTRSGDNLQGKLHPLSIGFVYQEALHLYKKGAKTRAEIAFKQVLETVPDHSGAEFNLAKLLFERGNFDDAERAFLTISKKVADPLPALLRLGETRVAQRDYVGAVSAFEDVLSRAPFHHEALYKCGVAMTAAGRHQDAAGIFQRLCGLYSDDTVNMQYSEKARSALLRINASLKPDIAAQASVMLWQKEQEQAPRWSPPRHLH